MTKNEFINNLGLQLNVEPKLLDNDAALASFSGWDSMGIIAIVAFLDAELEFDAPQGALQKCVTVGDLVALVSSKLSP